MSKSPIRSDSATPIRSQLTEILIGEIRQGRFASGGRIPSERELAERYKISRASVRESITELIQAGVLFRTVGKGTFVSDEGVGLPPKSEAAELYNVCFVISSHIFHFVQTGYNKIFSGIQQVCADHGWRLLFHADEENSRHPPLQALRHKGRLTLDGCVVVGGVRRQTLDAIAEEGVPAVLVDWLVSDEVSDTVAVRIDYLNGARAAVRHLYDLGHRTIGYIGFSGSEKYRGYWSALEEMGMRYEPRHVEFLQLLDLQPGILAGYQAVQRIVKSGNLPTALLVTNDFVALGVMEALAIVGIPVPEKVSIVGFDDLGQLTTPPLTTVRVDLVEVGRHAARALQRKMAGEGGMTDVLVPAELVVRGTTTSSAKLSMSLT
jgi:GntR family transcriptional regulator of arabinose operon